MPASKAVGEEMLALAELLDDLHLPQWNAPSLCARWRVRDVVAHMTAGAEGAFGVRNAVAGLLRYRFDYNKWIATDGQARGAQEPAVILTSFRNAAVKIGTTDSLSVRDLAHVLIHGQDICRPLGLDRQVPESHLLQVADFVATSIIFRAKRHIGGLKLIATDADWSRGDGPEASGPIEALVMVMAGRAVALEDLSGEGTFSLRRALVP